MQHNCPRVQISAVSLSKFGTCVQSVNRELGRVGEAQKLLFPASSLFDKIVRQQKEKKKTRENSICCTCVLFFLILREKRKRDGKKKEKLSLRRVIVVHPLRRLE